MDTSVWWSGDLFSAMRTTLGADRAREHLEAHARGETVTHVHLRAEQVVDWATRGGARALGRDDLGRIEPGAKADVVLIKNDSSPVSFPLLNPYGHVAFQAQRGDVHTVIVNGRVVKHDHTRALAEAIASDPQLQRRLGQKRARRARDERIKPLDSYRHEELSRSHECFFGADPSYHEARRRFIYKTPATATFTAQHQHGAERAA